MKPNNKQYFPELSEKEEMKVRMISIKNRITWREAYEIYRGVSNK